MQGKLALVISTMMIQAVTGSPLNSPSVSSPETSALERRGLERRAGGGAYTKKKKCLFTKYGEAKPKPKPKPTPPAAKAPKPTTPASKPKNGSQNNNQSRKPSSNGNRNSYSASNQNSKPANQPAYGSDFEKACMEGHNSARQAVGLPPLEWDEGLVKNGQGWSNKLANEKADIYHSQGSGEGENLYSYSSSYPISDNDLCKRAVEDWVGERKLYEKDGKPAISGNNYHGWGHYTQIVWRATTKVGCAVSINADKKQYVTCRYKSAGNIIGQKPY